MKHCKRIKSRVKEKEKEKKNYLIFKTDLIVLHLFLQSGQDLVNLLLFQGKLNRDKYSIAEGA